MNLSEVGLGGMDWTGLIWLTTGNSEKVLENIVMNFRVP
jgi:hypothetical protein